MDFRVQVLRLGLRVEVLFGRWRGGLPQRLETYA